ncbi:hypothetical protein pipiens_020491, partial [Culex pipiens pipiens]
MDVAYCFDYRR